MKKQNTRELLLDSAFNTFYKHGFQGANIANILNDVGINKGSMYHFFKSKKELGLAVVTERIESKILKKYEEVLKQNEAVKHLFDTLRSAPETLAYGCPLNKMSQEMLYIDDEFKVLLSKVYLSFEEVIEKILEKEKVVEAKSKAKLIIATYEGALMIYHLNQNKLEFREVLSSLEKQIL
ncbi:MAG TPA: TetR family transcriptional regulator [Campylobacterales bacterium]|nr:TetR family transcriptional regulator [Campylobacterales bacterium]